MTVIRQVYHPCKSVFNCLFILIVFNYCASCAWPKKGGSLKRSLGMVRCSLYKAQLLITIGISSSLRAKLIQSRNCKGAVIICRLCIPHLLTLIPNNQSSFAGACPTIISKFTILNSFSFPPTNQNIIIMFY